MYCPDCATIIPNRLQYPAGVTGWRVKHAIQRKGRNSMKKLWVYLRPYKVESMLAPLFKLLEVVFDLLVPLVVAQMIDVGVAHNDRGYMLWCAAILLGMAFLGLASSITAQFFAARASVSFAAGLRQGLFDHIQSLSFTELDRLGTDTLITRLNDDVNQVQNGLNMGLRLLLRSPFIVLGAMALAFTISVECAWIFVVAIPALFVVVFAIMLVSIPLFRKVQAGLDRVTGLTRENLTGVRVIRAFCREEHSVEEFEASNRGLTRLNEFVGRISALLNPLTYVLINLAAVFLIDRAAIQVNVGGLGQGDVVALYNYMLQIIVELIKMASLIITLNKALACAGRVAGILQVETSMEYPAGEETGLGAEGQAAPAAEAWGTGPEKTVADAQMPVVRFQDVTFSYQGAGAPSLSHISFTANRGETIGIIGGTGSGKSTLVSLIPRFYDAGAGSVELDGRDVKDYPREALNRKVGVVQQRTQLFRGTIRENLTWGDPETEDASLWEALTMAQAKEVVEGKPDQLDFKLEQNGRNLSGGQRQRLSIARTLIKKPEILILDDSSSALDFATDAALRKAIHGLGGQVTTFLVSQRIAGVRQADRILVLDDGRLEGQGTHEELMACCGTYREIYYSQFPEERPGSGGGTEPAGTERTGSQTDGKGGDGIR